MIGKVQAAMSNKQINDVLRWGTALRTLAMDAWCTEVKKYINEDTKLGSKGLSRIANLSPATISQGLSGKYDGDMERVRQRITAAIELHRERRLRERPEIYVRTDQSKVIESAIMYALKEKQSAAVLADSGLGKSTAARHVIAREEFGMVYVLCDSNDYGPIAFLDRIANALGMKGYQTKSCWRLQRLITERFSDNEWVLVVDDAHYLIDPKRVSRSQSLDVVKDLSEHAGTPFVLLGVPELWEVVQRRLGDGWYAQLHGRVGITQHLTRRAVQADDVEQIVRSLGASCSPAVLQVLTQLARDPGGYRNVEKAVRWCTRDGSRQVTADAVKVFLAATSNMMVRQLANKPTEISTAGAVA